MDLAKIIAEATSQAKYKPDVPQPIINIVDTPEQIDDMIEEVVEAKKVTLMPDRRCGKDFVPTDSECVHLCECENFWTHGLKAACRFPDMLKQGLCPDCLGIGKQQTWTMDEDFVDGKLSQKAQIIVRNKALKAIQNMNADQLTEHIKFLEMRIQELHLEALETRSRRAVLEEDEIYALPEEERERYRQALRRGDKPKKEKKAPKVSKKEEAAQKERDLAKSIKVEQGHDAKLVAQWMIKTGKSQAQVEAYLYD